MTLRSRANSPAFEDGYDAIFGKDKQAVRGSWVQDAKTGEFIDKSERYVADPDAPMVLGSPEEFRSPIDGQMISDRGQLRRHNAKHGVTNIQDYGSGYFDRKASERQAILRGDSRAAKDERVDTIKRAIAQHENR